MSHGSNCDHVCGENELTDEQVAFDSAMIAAIQILKAPEGEFSNPLRRQSAELLLAAFRSAKNFLSWDFEEPDDVKPPAESDPAPEPHHDLIFLREADGSPLELIGEVSDTDTHTQSFSARGKGLGIIYEVALRIVPRDVLESEIQLRDTNGDSSDP